ncbi:hypothetical protein, partial [Prevotellamassilia timonensis]|uniref:hypothetical protein n=1 Tax=Prevotellamassilia timonensis TaxID=1852370 RepID=UPI00307BE051
SYVYFVQYLRHVLKLLPFQGATAPTRDTQGVASLALGYGLHWAFSPHLLNPKLEKSNSEHLLNNGKNNIACRQWQHQNRLAVAGRQ